MIRRVIQRRSTQRLRAVHPPGELDPFYFQMETIIYFCFPVATHALLDPQALLRAGCCRTLISTTFSIIKPLYINGNCKVKERGLKM
jgi:hypothetical protein